MLNGNLLVRDILRGNLFVKSVLSRNPRWLQQANNMTRSQHVKQRFCGYSKILPWLYWRNKWSTVYHLRCQRSWKHNCSSNLVRQSDEQSLRQTLRGKCPYLELLWSAFSSIRTECGPEQLRQQIFFTQWKGEWYT